MDNDIYKAPESNLIKEEENGEVVLASRWSRMFASILDTIILMIVIVPLMFLTGGLDGPMSGQQNSIVYTVVFGFASILIFVLLNGFLLKKYGQTIGKKALGIRVVTLEDALPPLKTLLVRYAVFFIPGQIPFIGQLFSIVNVLFIFGSKKRCLHDLAAKTKVIKN